MNPIQDFIFLLSGFLIVTVAANQIARLFRRINLPIITGFLIMGLITGPFILKLIPSQSKDSLFFINEISLAFIAFAASGELYLKELRNRFKSIRWMTFSQLGVTFIIGSLVVFLVSSQIHFMDDLPRNTKAAISMLIGIIFVARSPASAIAVISEMRAKGPFTRTALGVTVVKDCLVIVLFSIILSISGALVEGIAFSLTFLFIIIGVSALTSTTPFKKFYKSHQPVRPSVSHRFPKTRFLFLEILLRCRDAFARHRYLYYYHFSCYDFFICLET